MTPVRGQRDSQARFARRIDLGVRQASDGLQDQGATPVSEDFPQLPAGDLDAMNQAGGLVEHGGWEVEQDDERDLEEPMPSGGMMGPINWWALSPSAQATVLAGLSVWVTRLVRTFQIEWTEIPPWWYRHEGFIHELLALKQAREQVAYDPAEAESAPLTWLHNLSLARGRLRALRDSLGGDYRTCPEPRVPGWAALSGDESRTWQVEVERYAMDMTLRGSER